MTDNQDIPIGFAPDIAALIRDLRHAGPDRSGCLELRGGRCRRTKGAGTSTK